MLPHAIPLENASNLRDLGGWPIRDGRHVRRGLVFRAPALINLSVADEAVIAGLGLRTICDFRGVRERAHAPVGIGGARNLSLPIEPSVGGSLRDILRTGELTGRVDSEAIMLLLRSAYRAYALQSADRYRALFAEVLSPEGLPLLLHCTAGKDRTGFGSALLLTALGVDWPQVVEDFLATNRLWRRETATMVDLSPPIKEALLGAHETLLADAFDAVRATHGSVDAYLDQVIGLDAAARARLEGLLLE